MSDLINRSALIKVLKARATNEAIMGYMTAYDVTNSIIDEVEEQPTAYDINNVIEELERNASRYTKKYVTPYGNNGYRDTKAISIHKAIEIVKQGGVSDDVCEWKYNDTEYYWESSCEHLHIFMADGPKENEYSFCPYCGKKIKEVE